MTATLRIPRPPAPPPEPSLAPFIRRWLVIALCTVVAFHDSLLHTASALADGDPGLSLTVILLGVIMLLGIDRRRRGELPIHDRQVDTIVGLLTSATAIAIKAELAPRYASRFDLLRIDDLALIVFLFGTCSIMFGLRATARFIPLWLMLWLAFPLNYVLVHLMLGGGWFGWSSASVLLAAGCLAVTVGAPHSHRLIAAGSTLAVGFTLVLLLGPVANGLPPVAAQLPAIGAAITVTLGAYLFTIRRHPGTPRIVRHRIPTVPSMWPGIVPLVLVTVILALIPLPELSTRRVDAGPPSPGEPVAVTVPGWQTTGHADYPWAHRMLGSEATLGRTTLTAQEARLDWDLQGRPRHVVVDRLRTSGTAGNYNARLFPGESMYTTVTGRQSPTRLVDLGRGVTASVYTVLDEDLFLTWTRLHFTWSRGGAPGESDTVTESFDVIAVDDHELDAPFPELTPSLAGLIGQIVSVLVRGNSIEVNRRPDYKDFDVVVDVAQGIVETEWGLQ